MKTSRITRAWRSWLAMPEVIRLGAVILLLILLGLAWPAHADMMARSGKNELRLMDTPCRSDTVRELLKEEWRNKFKAAHADVNGIVYAACWIDTGRGAYFVIFDDGDTQVFPATVFFPSGA
jgi:hypothetical protein